MSLERFAMYARVQIDAANDIVARHHPAAADICSCGRETPCILAATYRRQRDEFLAKLTAAEQTSSSSIDPVAAVPMSTLRKVARS